MLIKSIRYFIASLYGVKQVTILGPQVKTDYDPLSLAQLSQCEIDFKAVTKDRSGYMIAVRETKHKGWMISPVEKVNDLQVFDVHEHVFNGSTFRPWKHVEDLSNDAQAWLKPWEGA